MSCPRHKDSCLNTGRSIYRFDNASTKTHENAVNLNRILNKCLPGNCANIHSIEQKIFTKCSRFIYKSPLPNYFPKESENCFDCKEEFFSKDIEKIIDAEDKTYLDLIEKSYRNFLAKRNNSNTVPRNLEELFNIDEEYYKKTNKKWKVLMSIIFILFMYSFVLPDEEFNNIQKLMLIYLLWAIFENHFKYVWYTAIIYFCKSVVILCDFISSNYWASRYFDWINNMVTNMALNRMKNHEYWKLFKKGVL